MDYDTLFANTDGYRVSETDCLGSGVFWKKAEIKRSYPMNKSASVFHVKT